MTPPRTPGRGGWAACGASVTGKEHQRRGLGCDDAFGYGVADDFLVAAVADGAGSVTGTSAWGSHAACLSVIDDALCPEFIDRFRCSQGESAQQLVRLLFERALERVTRQAHTLSLDVPLLSTTLSVALADRRQAAFGQVGDGVIAVERDARISTILTEDKDDFANITSFIQSPGAFEKSFRTTVLTDVTAVALSTDGLAYKITDVATGYAFEPFFRDSWRHIRVGADTQQLGALLNGIEDDQTGDDKTLVLAVANESLQPNERQAHASFRYHSAPPVWPEPAPADGAPHDDRGSEALTVPMAHRRATRRRWWRVQRR